MITNSMLRRGLYLAAALAFSACPSDTKCTTNSDCATGQVCNVSTGVCGTSATGGGGGSNSGGGTATGGGSSTGGGTATGGGSNTGGGNTGGGQGTGGGMGTGGGTMEDGGVSGDTCEDAVTLAAGSIDDDTTNTTNNYVLRCSGFSNPGNDKVYKVTVPAGQQLSAAVTPVDITDDGGLPYDPSIYIVGTPATNCLTPDQDGGTGTDVCLGGADSNSSSLATDTAFYNNTGTTPVDVFVIVDSAFDGTDMDAPLPPGGLYSLDIAFGPIPGGNTCADATPLVVGTPLTGQSLDGFTHDYDEDTTCSLQSGPDRAYTLTVPAGEILDLSLTLTGAADDLDATLNLVADVGSCGTACLAFGDDGYDGDDEALTWRNTGTSPATLLVVVGSWSGTGTFTLSATTRVAQAGDVCSDALPLTSSLANQSLTGFSNDYGSGVGCGSGVLSNDRAYQVTVPAGQRGAVTVTPALGTDGGATFSPSLALVTGAPTACDVMPRTCTTGVIAAPRARTASVVNSTDAGLSVYAIVDTSSTTPGNFDISFATTAVATDDTCTTANTTLVAGTPLVTNLDGFYFDYAVGAGCVPNPGGVDRVFKVSAGANQRLELTATPTVVDGGMDMLLNVYDSVANCDGATRACVASVDAIGRGTPEKLVIINNSATAKDYFVSAADYDQGISGSSAFTFTATVGAIPAGEICETAEAITMSGTTMNLDFANLGRQYTVNTAASTCSSYTGAERVYSVSLTAGQMLSVSATGAATQDLVLNLVTGTAASCSVTPLVCAAKSDMGDVGEAESVMYTNTTGAAQTVFIIVSSYSAASNTGAFSLTTQIQ